MQKKTRQKIHIAYSRETPTDGRELALDPIASLSNKLDRLEAKIPVMERNFRIKIENISKGFEKKMEGEIKVATKEFEEKIKDREIRTTEILAIFITLFTFISVNVSIFTRVEDLHTAIWFILLFTDCSIVLLASLFLFISKDRKEVFKTILFITVSLLIVLLFTTRYTQWNPKLNQANENKMTN